MLTSQHRNTISYSTVFTSQTLAHPNVRRVPLATPPRACDARKRPVRMVKLVVITIQEKCGEGFLWDWERGLGFHKELFVKTIKILKFWRFWRRETIQWKWTIVRTHYPEEPEESGRRGGVEWCVMMGRSSVVLPCLIALGIEHGSLWIQSSDWLY